jgi:hypothetical protein
LDNNRGQRTSSLVTVIFAAGLTLHYGDGSSHPPPSGKFGFRISAAPQRITSVLIRLGTSPTGMFATTFIALVSMADTDLIPEFET